MKFNSHTLFADIYFFVQDKYLKCDPLPDPTNEKDLTTFITLWREKKEKDLEECLNNCQTAENVLTNMQDIYGEALALN